MKICRIVFSTNRLEFLIPTLETHKQFIDFGNHEVYSILFDDYPDGRNDDEIIQVAKNYNFNEVILHTKNQGISLTWNEAWNLIKDKQFDYVWHHEDDVKFLQPVKIDFLINILSHYKDKFAQVVLKRNAWYEWEINQPETQENDMFFENHRINPRSDFFWSMASLYPHWITKEPIVEKEGCNLGEYPIMEYVKKWYNMRTAVLKNWDGTNMIEHIGFYFKGRRITEGEPGWHKFGYIEPHKRYCSRTGMELLE